MKFFTAKYLSVVLLACALTGSIEASRCAENNCAQEERGCCFSSCYECGCNPLYCGAWDLQVQAGVAPIIWRNRGDVLGIACGSEIAGAPVFTLFPLPKFSSFFKTPWTVGGQVGFHWSDNVRAYVEFNYLQAKAKSDAFFAIDGTLLAAGSTLNFVDQSKYKLFDVYVGARYYFDRWCDRVAFFLGGKVGLTHHKRVSSSVAVVVAPAAAVTLLTDIDLYGRNNVVSGGADFGLDICFCGNWSFVITGSVLASCAASATPNLVIPDNESAFTVTNLLVTATGTELRFPVTAGVRYSF